jgi:predicted nucleic acid-binding protein
MIVVADSSPLQYLILLDQSSLLQHLYGHVFVPDIVAAELRAPGAPESVRRWMWQPPAWLDVVATTPAEQMSISDSLDRGERSAIALAERLRAELILIHEKDGRNEALQWRFQVTGTLGVLRAAAERGLIDVRPVLCQGGRRPGLNYRAFC